MPDHVAFTASEYQADGAIRPARYAFTGTREDGWIVEREGREHLRLGPGYRLLRTIHCGVCATDLARRWLPFPLPQVTGHEVVARGDDGAPVVVEINASCRARRLVPCPTCEAGLPTHCPERRVLGIHDLPGGFGPWILAPVDAVRAVPAGVSTLGATFAEPFAAAWWAVTRVAPEPGDRVVVVGPGRLGSLVVAALGAWRTRAGVPIGIVAVGRSPGSRDRARRLGADATVAPDAAPDGDVVIETSGTPEGAALALRLARRELHLKSTSGRPALGLDHATALVVDELAIVRGELAPPDAVAARTEAEIDAAIRPAPDRERSAAGPRGVVAVADVGQPRTPLLDAVLGRGVRITTSRCGDVAAALDVLAAGELAERLAQELVRARVPAERLADAFARAASGGDKVVVTHADG